eukprot:COSAG05_NODE_4817_length_1361_cov_1.454041_2_plen_80_part_00
MVVAGLLRSSQRVLEEKKAHEEASKNLVAQYNEHAQATEAAIQGAKTSQKDKLQERLAARRQAMEAKLAQAAKLTGGGN